jgi:FAD:protein FMN transferase
MSGTCIVRNHWPLILLLILVTQLCLTMPGQKLKRYDINGYAQGTTYHLIYYAARDVVTRSQVEAELKNIDRSVSLYLPSSLICQFNRSGKGIKVDETFKVLVKKAMAINKDTQGAVDVTVKPLVDAWGFGAVKALNKPDSAAVNKILKHVGANKIWLQGNVLHKRDAKVQIDLNGIAQGYTADRLAQLLESKGVKCYMAEIGGELRVKGNKPDGKPFSVGVEGIEPDDMGPASYRRVVALTSGAITTSGNYRKYVESNGKKLSHLIDPRTGHPADNEMISVTVIAKDGITADGYDNGFMVMGLSKTLQTLAHRADMGAYIVYRKPDGAVADTATRVFINYMYTTKNE